MVNLYLDNSLFLLLKKLTYKYLNIYELKRIYSRKKNSETKCY